MQKEPLTAIGTYLIVMINFIYTQEVVDEMIQRFNDLMRLTLSYLKSFHKRIKKFFKKL